MEDNVLGVRLALRMYRPVVMKERVWYSVRTMRERCEDDAGTV